MTSASSIARVAALLGDPTRANMLIGLMDGRAHTPTELAAEAGVGAATASGHLAQLRAGGLVAVVPQGRHRYYRLASPDAARLVESLMAFGAPPESGRRAAPRAPQALRAARTCYDHLAGRLGVGLADAMIRTGVVRLGEEAGEVTAVGLRRLRELGVELPPSGRRRPPCRPCLDWSERRPHLGGALGAALLSHGLQHAWIERAPDSRAVRITARGRVEFRRRFDLEDLDGG